MGLVQEDMLVHMRRIVCFTWIPCCVMPSVGWNGILETVMSAWTLGCQLSDAQRGPR